MIFSQTKYFKRYTKEAMDSPQKIVYCFCGIPIYTVKIDVEVPKSILDNLDTLLKASIR